MVVVVLVGLGGLIGLIVVGGTVITIVVGMGLPSGCSRGSSRRIICVTGVLLIGMLNIMNNPKNKLVNKTTTTRLTQPPPSY